MPSTMKFSQISYPIRIILPIIYTVITVVALIGNALNFYSLCVSKDRYIRKSIHGLIWNLVTEGTFWVSIFYTIKVISYTDLGEHLSTNDDNWLSRPWCKAEMYILRVMDFLLAYTIVFLCLDRCVKRKGCCYGQRRFVTGICILISMWLIVCYALIPILFLNQHIKPLNYGSYECVYNETEINQLVWLNVQNIQTPYKTIYLIDFIFGNALPIVLMLFLLTLRSITHKTSKANKNEHENNVDTDELNTDAYKQYDFSTYDDEHPNLIKLVVLYVVVYILCQLPYNVYRLIRVYDPSVESNLLSADILYAMNIPLLILRLMNRAINPWLSYFLVHSIQDSSRPTFLSFWCCSFLPCCANRWSCLRDFTSWLWNKWLDITASSQVTSELRPTGKTIRKDFCDSTGKHIRQTYDEYVQFYYRPRIRFSDANPALLYIEANSAPTNDRGAYLDCKNTISYDQSCAEL